MAPMSVFKSFSWSSLIFTNPLALSDLANAANVIETPTIVLLLSSFFLNFYNNQIFLDKNLTYSVRRVVFVLLQKVFNNSASSLEYGLLKRSGLHSNKIVQGFPPHILITCFFFNKQYRVPLRNHIQHISFTNLLQLFYYILIQLCL